MKPGGGEGGREEGTPLGGDDTGVRRSEGAGQREIRTNARQWAWQMQKPRGRNTAVSVRDRRGGCVARTALERGQMRGDKGRHGPL